jgi:hypothetical protein
MTDLPVSKWSFLLDDEISGGLQAEQIPCSVENYPVHTNIFPANLYRELLRKWLQHSGRERAVAS